MTAPDRDLEDIKTKNRCVALLMLVALLLTGCASTATDNDTVEVGGVELTVDRSLSQVTDGQHVYDFTREEDRITVVYPNGVTYIRMYSDGVFLAETFDGDASGYLAPDTVFAAIERKSGEEKADGGAQLGGMGVLIALLGVLFGAWGLWTVIDPQGVWDFEHSWRFENTTLSDPGLVRLRVRGVGMMIAGVFVIIEGIIGAF